MNQKLRNAVATIGFGALVLFAGSAAAVPPDFSDITDAVDWSTATTAILAVFALLAVVLVAFKGGKMVLRALR